MATITRTPAEVGFGIILQTGHTATALVGGGYRYHRFAFGRVTRVDASGKVLRADIGGIIVDPSRSGSDAVWYVFRVSPEALASAELREQVDAAETIDEVRDILAPFRASR